MDHLTGCQQLYWLLPQIPDMYMVMFYKHGSTLRVNLWPQASKNSQKQFRASKKRLQLVLQAQ